LLGTTMDVNSYPILLEKFMQSGMKCRKDLYLQDISLKYQEIRSGENVQTL